MKSLIVVLLVVFVLMIGSGWIILNRSETPRVCDVGAFLVVIGFFGFFISAVPYFVWYR